MDHVRKTTRDSDYGLHETIYDYIKANPGLRAKDIAISDTVKNYVAEHGYSPRTVPSYISAMCMCGLLKRELVEPQRVSIYSVQYHFDAKLIQALDRYYKLNNTAEGFDHEAERNRLSGYIAPSKEDLVDILSRLLAQNTATKFFEALPQALRNAEYIK